MNGMGQLSCGHDVPDSDKTSYKAGWDDFKVSYNLDVVLTEDYEVKHVGEEYQKIYILCSAAVGKWTMVYDEGFEIQMKGTKYMAFSKYAPNGGG